jgi:hypothetical protein
MRDFEAVTAIAAAVENLPIVGICGGQRIEIRETEYFEAVFVIELRGIFFASTGRGMPVASASFENNNHKTALLQVRGERL